MSKHIPRKRFGQHFLCDHDIIAAIVSAIRPQAGDNLVEIGPGLGALTTPLMANLTHFHVVELDRDIIARLQRTYPADKLTIHAGDALAFDFASLGTRLRIVGNLPYNISTPLLFHLAEFAPNILDMHFMLQKEVVERMTAHPNTHDYGRLSVMLQYRFDMESLFDVPPTAFDPPPKVDSAIVRMLPRPPEDMQAINVDTLAHVVSTAFAQRRKTLRNTLAGVLKPDDFVHLDIDPQRRAETVSVADFVRIANHIQPKENK
ncbi:16S rRNA (adenine(1518)-N(6)/adenine(1519)-N(6))-dimethyltransferase [Sulfuriferula sp. AH1]|uniref:16S rRNA (adenine(1518)-N(6)/adenine(1519)-N(6))- dimethyltransferase RsmA n=1 Tax=Sulfuriferula sp. AH1 TaxID=1985873 RepID=UPI000B3B4A70|nr:16S rRNA (adenine(1518)-N(6)/adenine(1519)-N(6))-dimethyltransferase RsmA [Sulfuriferula sp. AH1]ARU30562.1 16S rRNA (adenine(1518)-N(6)/adenine(1519)-N(6))-dimethyltransferase [Sulfuriferula sp. AH1]